MPDKKVKQGRPPKFKERSVKVFTRVPQSKEADFRERVDKIIKQYKKQDNERTED